MAVFASISQVENFKAIEEIVQQRISDIALLGATHEVVAIQIFPNRTDDSGPYGILFFYTDGL